MKRQKSTTDFYFDGCMVFIGGGVVVVFILKLIMG